MTILTLGIAEVVSTWWIEHQGDALQRARRIMILDTERGWRHASNLNTTFEKKTLSTDRLGFRLAGPPVDAPTILVLGPSSAFGWGVEANESWPALLEARMSHQGERVFNASQVGYTIVQGRRLYESMDKNFLTSLRTVLLAYGVNEVDRFRFFGRDPSSDDEYFARPLPISTRERFFNSFAFGALLWRAGQEASLLTGCGFKQTPSLRLSPKKFDLFLRDWAEKLRQEGKRVVLVNSAEEMPFAPDERRANLSDRQFTESESRSQAGDCTESRRLFKEARQNEPWRVLRDIGRINNVMSKVGRELSLPVADIATVLVSTRKGELFVDPIHPSAAGHRFAADRIEQTLSMKGTNADSTH